MNQSIVWFEEQEKERTGKAPLYFEDMNLDQVISYITKHYAQYHLEDFYYDLPQKTTCIQRQQVIKDMMNPRIYQQLKDFIADEMVLEERGTLETECKYRYQSMKLALDNCALFYRMFRGLLQCFEKEEPQSEGLKKLYESIQSEVFTEEGIRLEALVKEIEDGFENITFSACYDMEKISSRSLIVKERKTSVRIVTDKEEITSEDIEYENYQDKIAKYLFLQNLNAQKENHPFCDSKDINDFERNVLRILRKMKPTFFEKMEKLCAKPLNYDPNGIKEMVRECAFYVSYVEFVNSMNRFGYKFSLPEITNEEFSMINGYDLALALKMMENGGKIVPNCCDYQGKERFFIVTGPNQGGKTTFARMLGQQVYFAQMGLFVPAVSAKIPSFHAIHSHFAREEAEEVGAGKLKEELLRLAPILEDIKKEEGKRIYVVINELFTTAATYDAVVMGHKVIDYLCDSNCFGVYVTHVRELAEGKEETVSLTAEVSDDTMRSRTYKITRNEAAVGQAQSIAYKYGLTYEQMQRRVPQ